MRDAIIVENLTKRFRRAHADRPGSLKEAVLRGFRNLRNEEHFCALDDVSFRVKAGTMVGIIGQNGAGKSTLLRLIGGVGQPSGGKVLVNGRIGALLDLTAGFHPDLTGRENVFITGVICGLTRREVAERMNEIIAFAELEESIDNPIRTYSTGMQMRLGFSVAAHTDPEILLIDEVLAVGDMAFQQKCLARIKQFKERGCTILLISHDLSQAAKFCDEIIWLRSGRIAAQGIPEVIVGEYMAELASETRRRTPQQTPILRTSTGTELRVYENRFGSMEMEITSVRLFDANGLTIQELAASQPLSVSIEFRTSRPIQNPVFSVSISREDGFVCFDTNTSAQGLKLPTVDQRGQISLHLERLDLVGGKYFVDVGIYEKDFAYGYDYHWHAYPLEISGPTGNGILRSPQLWELGELSKNSSVVDGSLRPNFLEQLRTKL